ncbi:transposase [Blautia faecis]|uniref:transposase n=1 Tax=Blautia faecis TaxID=871665 RepID=UPI002FE6EEE0
MLEKSWANTFADKVFPAIDENIFSVLYSKKASRPNTPVNVIVGALILKEALNVTDDEIVEAMAFDIRYQYALHTTSFEEQPISDRTLSRFMQVEQGDKYLMTKKELENKIVTFTGGRAAEEIVFGEITTGASNDIEQATKIARAMITRYGMTDEFDMVAMETVTNQYLGGDTSLSCSTDTQKEIDEKVVQLVKAEHEKARKILSENREKLDELAMYLYEKETITGDEFMNILDRK